MKKKKLKCTECGDKIDGKPAYIQKRRVCKVCFERLK